MLYLLDALGFYSLGLHVLGIHVCRATGQELMDTSSRISKTRIRERERLCGPPWLKAKAVKARHVAVTGMERGKDPPKISLDIHGTTIIVAIMINTVYMASDSRTTASLNDTETMTCRETKKVRLILKDPHVLVALAGDLGHAVEVIDELELEAQLPGHFTIERFVDRARRFIVGKKSWKYFEIFICVAGKNKYHRRVTELGYDHILSSFIIGPRRKQVMFQALFEAGIQGGGSSGPPFRVNTIINGQVDYQQLNFIPLYQ
ncbi:hypothetical protein C1H46_029589 [Malus baccata]|uniref:Uncharacterized protein n=1 Tax=Malus baccata TaxID=106549 RepID=A0A540LEX0_MALBA|nr:hypothetical protein C1H46_029589 [Malus baccata]